MNQKFVDLDNARVDEQVKVMEQIIANDHCPFCWENLDQYHKQPILKRGNFWLVTTNQWPYNHTRHHYLLIYKSHIATPAGMESGAAEELFDFAKELELEYQLPGGALCMRFGDSNYSAGSVTHLHAQLIVPDITAKDYAPVRFKIGK